MAHLKIHHKELYDEVLITEMRVDDLWLTVRQGRNTLDKFREALKTWKDLHFKAIELYKGQRDQGEQREKGLFG